MSWKEKPSYSPCHFVQSLKECVSFEKDLHPVPFHTSHQAQSWIRNHMHLISKIKSCGFTQHYNINHKNNVRNKYGESYTSLHVSNSFTKRTSLMAFIKDMNMHIQLQKLIKTCGRWREENLRSAKRWMNKLGSTGFCMTGCCSSRSSWHNCRNTAPNTYLHCASHAPIQYN